MDLKRISIIKKITIIIGMSIIILLIMGLSNMCKVSASTYEALPAGYKRLDYAIKYMDWAPSVFRATSYPPKVYGVGECPRCGKTTTCYEACMVYYINGRWTVQYYIPHNFDVPGSYYVPITDPAGWGNNEYNGYWHIGKWSNQLDNDNKACIDCINSKVAKETMPFVIQGKIIQPITYYVQYNGNGATSGSMSRSEYVYQGEKNATPYVNFYHDYKFTLAPNQYVRNNYIFNGWNTKPDGTGTWYSNGQEIRNLTTTDNQVITLYAQWKRAYVDITLAPEGGISNSITKLFTSPGAFWGYVGSNGTRYSYSLNGKYLVKNFRIDNIIPTRSGYDFTGFFTQKNGQGEQIIDENGVMLKDYNYFTKDTTIYAHWSKGTSIRILPEGGTLFKSPTGRYDFLLIQKLGYYDIGNRYTYEDRYSWINPETGLTYMWTSDDGTSNNEKNFPESHTVTATRTGYTFKGIYTERNGKGTQFSDALGRVNYTPSKWKSMFPGDRTVYASWELITQNITGIVTWIDDNNRHGLRPGSVTISLSRTPNTGVVKALPSPISVIPDGARADGRRSYTFNGVQTYDTTTGKKYAYTVNQNNLGKNYTTTISKYTIVNKLNTYTIQGVAFLDSIKGNNKYDLNEGLSNIPVTLYDENNNQVGITLTDSTGKYIFKNLSPAKKYKVKFTYNGLLFKNVNYSSNGGNSSKVREQQASRTEFNNKFAEIGSYPNNYTTTDINTGATITNPIFASEEIVSLFKEVSQAIVNNNGNEKVAYKQIINKYGATQEIKNKIQFIRDCSIDAYSDLLDINQASFKKGTQWDEALKININTGEYTSSNINCGITVRESLDLVLNTDIYNAQIQINSKTGNYQYNTRGTRICKGNGDIKLSNRNKKCIFKHNCF